MRRDVAATAALVLLLLAACGGQETAVEPSTSLSDSATTTLPGPSTTVPGPTTTVPGPTTTVPGPTTTVPEPTTTVQESGPDVVIPVVYQDGEVEVDQVRQSVSLGSVVDIVIESDSSVEVHVHGYDILSSVEPGVRTAIRLEATIPGVFEVELEGSHVLLFELEVS